MSAARISVVVAARDGERYLHEALTSILEQTRPADQVVAVDDGSADRTAVVIEAFRDRVQLIRRQAGGVAAAINTGLDAADGEWLSFLDADDAWTPRKLELQGAVLESSPETDMVFGHVEQFISPDLSDDERAGLRPPGPAAPAKLKGTMLIRREAFDRVGRLDTSLKIADFVDWYVRASQLDLGEVMLREIVMRRRLHMANMGRLRQTSRAEYAGVLARARRRQRDLRPSDRT